MALPLYLAMTQTEIAENPLPEKTAYMACHFSASGKGLCDFPSYLPKGSMLILDDQLPPRDHDVALCCQQLRDTVESLECSYVLLDFQEPDNPKTAAMAKHMAAALPCPVGVTEVYAANLPCAVFLTAPLPNKPLDKKLPSWVGRELWLETVTESRQITVTAEGSTPETIPFCYPKEPWHRDERLCCRYHIELTQSEAVFTITRTIDDLQDLLLQAQQLGISLAVGLHQQFL